MEIWVPITIFAAFCQTMRSALQKHLTGHFGPAGATFVRFGYGFPFALLWLLLLSWLTQAPWPDFSLRFYLAASSGGAAQIAATFMLVKLFSLRNFAVGTAYSKTEPVLAALFAVVLLGEHLGFWVWCAVAVGVAGVVLISTGRAKAKAGDVQPSKEKAGPRLLPIALGIGAAALFGASAACYRLACLALEDTEFLMQAALALAWVTGLQTICMGGWLAWRRPAELRATLRHWRMSSLVGLAGVAGSVGWFTAMTLQQVAYVRALGQVELVFTFVVSWLIFGERLSRRDLAGCLIIVASVLGIVLLG